VRYYILGVLLLRAFEILLVALLAAGVITALRRR